MARKKSLIKHTQINLSIPVAWKEQLENLSRIYSVEENKTITVSDLIRRGLKEKFQLEDCNDDSQ